MSRVSPLRSMIWRRSEAVATRQTISPRAFMYMVKAAPPGAALSLAALFAFDSIWALATNDATPADAIRRANRQRRRVLSLKGDTPDCERGMSPGLVTT